MKTYTTVQGDMWDSIAYQQMGSCRFTDMLISANRKYHRTYIFDAGVMLHIPDIPDASLVNSLLPPWKQVKN